MNDPVGMKKRIARGLEGYRRERIRRRALRTAMWRFSRLHPHWYESFFDETFLERLPAQVLADRDPVWLAREWARQFSYGDQRRRELDVRQMTPIAESFLDLLAMAEEELGGAPVPAPEPRIA